MVVQQVQEVAAKEQWLNMKSCVTYIAFLLVAFCNAQNDISKLLERYNLEKSPFISVEALANSKSKPIFLDAREASEYEVSHLQNAIHIGFDDFDISTITSKITDKNTAIVVYCSLGIRSEIITKKLIDVGYTNVKNLYGGIFEWKNSNKSIYNSEGTETDSIHAYSKSWSKWLKNGIKVYE